MYPIHLDILYNFSYAGRILCNLTFKFFQIHKNPQSNRKQTSEIRVQASPSISTRALPILVTGERRRRILGVGNRRRNIPRCE